MKICISQTRPVKGNIKANIQNHVAIVNLAVAQGADLVFFPELSITGYEPTLAKELAMLPDDERLDVFQALSDGNDVVIGVGIPHRGEAGIHISIVFFQPNQPREIYSKQHLHSDELPYFVEGTDQLVLTIGGLKVLPAICYESLLPEHAKEAFLRGADVYIASVAKPAAGVEKANRHYPNIAKQYSMIVLMANSVGQCDDFESVGQSGVWNNAGSLAGQLNQTDEGILIFDTNEEQIIYSGAIEEQGIEKSH